MNDARLVSYLNDHLAGSVVGVEIGGHCRDSYADEALVEQLDELLKEIEEDRAVLTGILERVGGRQNTAKNSVAWLTEKVARLKTFGAGNPATVAFSRMEQLEALMLGIRGKLALWEVLHDLAGSDERLTNIDWESLERRAADQVSRVNDWRRAAAREAFLTSDGPAKI